MRALMESWAKLLGMVLEEVCHDIGSITQQFFSLPIIIIIVEIQITISNILGL